MCIRSQLFGNSEEEEDLKADDADSGKEPKRACWVSSMNQHDDSSWWLEQELAALKRETEELKKIKSAMGTDAYPQLVFDKVKDTKEERHVRFSLTMNDIV